MVTAAAFIEKIKIPLEEQWGYIYGTWGRMWTEKLQELWSQPGHKNYEMTAKYGAKWIGRMVTDCSGLLRWALSQLGESIVHQARYQYSDYSSPKGKLVNGRREDGTLPLPGTAVFLQGKEPKIHHVGVYIGGDVCVEAKGTAYGVVTSHLSHWDHWGELKMVDYSKAAELETDSLVIDDTDAEAGTIMLAIVDNPNKWLNVRQNAGSQYPVVFQVEKGSEVEVLDAGEPEWWQIRYGGRTGWCFAKYLKVVGIADTDTDEPPQEAPDNAQDDDQTNAPIDANKAVLDALDDVERAVNEASEALARLKDLIKGGMTT